MGWVKGSDRNFEASLSNTAKASFSFVPPFELEMRETHCEDGTTSLPSVAGSSNAGGPPAPAFRDSFAHAFIARADLDRSRSLRRWSRVAFAARFSCGGWTKGGRM